MLLYLTRRILSIRRKLLVRDNADHLYEKRRRRGADVRLGEKADPSLLIRGGREGVAMQATGTSREKKKDARKNTHDC